MDESNHQQEPAPSFETPEKKKLSLRNKLLLGGAGVVLAAVAATSIGVAVAASGHKAPKATSSSAKADSTPEASSAAEPTPSATPETTTVPDTYNYGLTQADVAPLLAEDVYALNTGTVEDKAKIAMFYAQDLPQFAEDWALVSNNPKDALLPAVVGADNTPDEINAFISNAHRQAMTLRRADSTFDVDTSDKLLAASFINGTLSPVYQSLSNFGAQLDNGAGAPTDRTLPAQNYMQLPIINTASDKYTDAAGRTCIDMNITQPLNGGAAPITENTTVCLVKNDNGSIWMQR